MPGKRMIHDNALRSKKLNGISFGAGELWFRLLLLVDDNGNYFGDRLVIYANAMRSKKGSTAELVEGFVGELLDVKLIEEYRVSSEDEPYIHIVSFHEYQTLRKDRPITVTYPLHPGEMGPAFKESGIPTTTEWAEFEVDRTGYIYFIQSEDGGPIKIGFSEDPKTRLVALQTHNPAKLQILSVIEGSSDDETRLHKKFADHKVQGEWFRPHRSILDFIGVSVNRKEVAQETNGLPAQVGGGLPQVRPILEVEFEVEDKTKDKVESIRRPPDDEIPETENQTNFDWRGFKRSFKDATGIKPEEKFHYEPFIEGCKRFGEMEVRGIIDDFVTKHGGKVKTRLEKWTVANFFRELEDLIESKREISKSGSDDRLPLIVNER